jgi:hypothetical protein
MPGSGPKRREPKSLSLLLTNVAVTIPRFLDKSLANRLAAVGRCGLVAMVHDCACLPIRSTDKNKNT